MESDVALPPVATTVEGARVQARVALVLLRALQDQDRPGEVLDNESVGATLPRRFGLTDVVASQIRRYEREARLGGTVPESEVRDLIKLLVRRPDSESLFRRAGRGLAPGGGGGWRRLLPRRAAFALARGTVARRLRRLLGTPAVRVVGVPFEVELGSRLLVDGNGGEGCALVTGFSRAVLERYLRDAFEVSHTECRARGGAACRWTVSVRPAGAAPSEAPGEEER